MFRRVGKLGKAQINFAKHDASLRQRELDLYRFACEVIVNRERDTPRRFARSASS